MGLFDRIFRSEIFTWWNGNTYGTRWTTWRKGQLVGEDQGGNRYYEARGGTGPANKPRRWVVYAGQAEPSTVPADWHGWLHYTTDTPPTKETYQPKPWQKPHEPNHTGTPLAYRPSGSTLVSGERPPATGDYQPWRPE